MSQAVDSAVSARAEGKQIFGQPRGIATLFLTEMWERFAFYGARALLILFMTAATARGGLGIADKTASSIYGLYLAGGYLSSLAGGLPVTQNAARGKSYGAELEITGQFGGLAFNFGGGYLHARFDGSSCITDTNLAGTDPGCPTGLRLVPDGRVLPFAPEWTMNAGIQYEIPLGGDDMSLTPRLQWSYLSQQVATPFPSFNTIVPEHNVFDARLTLQINRSYKLEGFVMNFTDRHYIASQLQNSSSADGGSIYGAPRTWGIRAVAKF